MSFIWPLMLITLLLTPLSIGWYIWLQRKRQLAAASSGTLRLIQNQSEQTSSRQRYITAILFIIGFTILLFSLARPEMFVDLPRTEGTVILAFDVSNSMAADDLEPTRMDAAKSAARIFVENQPPGILIGVVAFSNSGLIIQPPTNDQASIIAAIDRLTPQGSTSLGQGIYTSLNAIAGEPIPIDMESVEAGTFRVDISPEQSSVILLLTDGENTQNPEPLDIAQLAAEAGIRIYPVGVGSREGTIIQVDGFNVVTYLNEVALQEIASVTNGSYYYAEDEETLNDIYRNVNLHLTTRGEKIEVTAIFAGISLLFLIGGGMLSMLWFGRMPL